MDAQTLLAKPKKKPEVVAKVTTINPLVKVSTKAKKTSIALRKTFEKGIYQRKTQLSVLNRYKKRLDSIQKENDNKYVKKQKQKPKGITLPKFKGNFFTAGASDDLLKSLGALAAFNSVDKLMQGDFLGALSPGMVAAAALLGPGLLGMAGSAFFKKGPKATRLYGSNLTWERAKQGRYTDKGEWRGAEKDIRERYARRYGQRAANKKFTNDGVGFAVDNRTKGARAAKSLGRFGASIIPGVGAVVGAADAAYRAQAGDQTGAAIAGTGAALDAFAAGSAATGIGLPLAGLASIASFALDLTNLTRDLLGVSANEEKKNKLKEQEKKQKALVEGKGNLTFGKTLVSYEKALMKFESFAGSFKSGPKTDEAYRESFEPGVGGDTTTFTGGTGGGPKASAEVLADAASFRQTFPLPAGTPAKSAQPYELQMRENTGLGDLGNDPTVDDVHVTGSAHYSNRAIDIPINNMELGDRVAKFWQDKGYYVLWRTSGHYNHVHVQWAEKKGASSGIVASGPNTGYPVILHGEEAIIPISNKFTQSGGDPLENIPPSVVNLITSKSKIYQTAMQELPPEMIQVPIPMPPPQIRYISSPAPLNTGSSSKEETILKMMYYRLLG
jgi:hypothetical protein